MLLFHNRGSFQRFVRRLKAQYGDVETLNREWGLTYWSHRLSRLVGPVDARRQHAAPVRPRVAAVPGRPHDRVHRLAGRHRARVRPTRPVRHDVHRLPAAGRRRRGARRGARPHRGQPVLRDAGPPRRAPRARARDAVDDLGRRRAAPPGRSALLVEAVAVPRHRDRRPVDRRVRRSTCRPTPASSSRRPSRSSRAARR